MNIVKKSVEILTHFRCCACDWLTEKEADQFFSQVQVKTKKMEPIEGGVNCSLCSKTIDWIKGGYLTLDDIYICPECISNDKAADKINSILRGIL